MVVEADGSEEKGRASVLSWQREEADFDDHSRRFLYQDEPPTDQTLAVRDAKAST